MKVMPAGSCFGVAEIQMRQVVLTNQKVGVCAAGGKTAETTVGLSHSRSLSKHLTRNSCVVCFAPKMPSPFVDESILE
jgi:hypothetical protein